MRTHFANCITRYRCFVAELEGGAAIPARKESRGAEAEAGSRLAIDTGAVASGFPLHQT